MNTAKITEFIDKTMEITKRNSPALLTGSAVVGLLATTVSAFKMSPKAHIVWLEYKTNMGLKRIKGNKKAEKEETIQMIKELIPVVAPTVIMGTATAACIIGSNSISSRRIAALSTAYAISETAVKNLNDKMTETLGEKKTQAIKDAIVKDKMEKNPPPTDTNQIIMTGDGDVMCMDVYSGRYFRSNAQKIGQAINELSYQIQNDMYVSLNEFYEKLNIPEIPMGYDLGWNLDDAIKGQLPITITAGLTPDQQPCLCVDYSAGLRSDFRHLH